MSTAKACEVLEGMLNHGVAYVFSYLSNTLRKPVVIADYIGRIQYSESSYIDDADDMFISIPECAERNEFYFQEEDGVLYHKVGDDDICAYVIVKEVVTQTVQSMSSVIRDVDLAIKCHFLYLSNKNRAQCQAEKELLDYVLLRSPSKIKEILKLSDTRLDLEIDKPYAISMTRIDESDNEIDLELIRAYTQEFLKQVKLDAVPIIWHDRIVIIATANYNDNTLELDKRWPRIDFVVRRNSAIEAMFNVTASSSIGSVYPFLELHKSFNEARFAMTLPQLFGKKGFVQSFSDLGIFALIMSQDPNVLIKHCRSTLERILEYDSNNGSDLLFTLRKLLDNGVNWKDTADSLFIHTNTLHYRISRVEQLLDVDFGNMDVRTNLYITIKVWDTLQQNGFV